MLLEGVLRLDLTYFLRPLRIVHRSFEVEVSGFAKLTDNDISQLLCTVPFFRGPQVPYFTGNFFKPVVALIGARKGSGAQTRILSAMTTRETPRRSRSQYRHRWRSFASGAIAGGLLRGGRPLAKAYPYKAAPQTGPLRRRALSRSPDPLSATGTTGGAGSSTYPTSRSSPRPCRSLAT